MPGSTSRADADSTGPTAEAHAKNRAELREIQGEMKRDRDVLAQTSNTGVAQKLDRANQCFEITKQDAGGRAGALDAGVLKLAAEIGAEQAGNLAKGSPEEFVKHLVKKFAFMNSSRINLVALGNQVDEMRVFMHVPAVTFLMGSVEKPKERKAREKRKEREAPAELVHAKHVGVEDLDAIPHTRPQHGDEVTRLRFVDLNALCLSQGHLHANTGHARSLRWSRIHSPRCAVS